ncbi:hypothetical protein GQ53DRAFT_445487 [Thozetella sp. PMI_491]|nr:hypothetical protein GQ53DRAFT_445487 [Thozetella sp. PMI_491]
MPQRRGRLISHCLSTILHAHSTLFVRCATRSAMPPTPLVATCEGPRWVTARSPGTQRGSDEVPPPLQACFA